MCAMIAAVYARKSTEQSGASDDAKSVTRQIEHAAAYAAAEGWTVPENCFVDDGVSGAEFAKRAGFVRLMNALKPRPAFDVLVMSELSRLGREQIETAYAFKQLSTAGVRCFSYLEKREILMETPTDKFLMSAVTFSADLERDKASQRTYDALLRKARAAHVTGGRLFGYDNRVVLGADGRRSHVERVIRAEEAAVVRRIFELTAEGCGLTRVTKLLNAEGCTSPRAQRGRPKAWAPSSVREVLRRDTYRGVIVWNKSKKRDKWGRQNQQDRPARDWISVPAPHLQIVSNELWAAAHTTMARNRARSGTDTRSVGRPPGSGAKYLLSGLMRCAECGAGLEARTRRQGQRRVLFYGCSSYSRRGTSVCTNNLMVPAVSVEAAVLRAVDDQLLSISVAEEALRRATAAIVERQPDRDGGSREELARVEAEGERLTLAIASGGELSPLVHALRDREARREFLLSKLAGSGPDRVLRVDRRAITQKLRSVLANWRRVLRQHPEDARLMLSKLIVERLTFSPESSDEGVGYRFSGTGTLVPVIAGVVPHNLASPTGFEPVSWP
jgi:site-specific DNA recombinase